MPAEDSVRISSITIVVLAMLLVLNHGGTGEVSGTQLSDDDRAMLLLINIVHLESSYEEVRRHVPELGELVSEGGSNVLGERGLLEATASVEVFELPAMVEFNFEDGRLYGYYFWLYELDESEARRLYGRLRGFYSSAFGNSWEEVDREGGHASETTYWSTKRFDVAATVTTQGNSNTLSWGFQRLRVVAP